MAMLHPARRQAARAAILVASYRGEQLRVSPRQVLPSLWDELPPVYQLVRQHRLGELMLPSAQPRRVARRSAQGAQQ